MQRDFLNIPNMILIGSTGRNSGKTYLGVRITRILSRTYHVEALKIATIRQKGAPCIHGDRGCGMCTSFSEEYRLFEEISSDLQKDTSRYLAAGADKSYLLKCTRENLMRGIRFYMENTRPEALIICESNSLREVVNPGIFIMVKGPGNIKQSAENVMRYADIIYSNLR